MSQQAAPTSRVRKGHTRPYALYTKAEIALVREQYARLGAKPLAAAMGRNVGSIVALAGRLGVRFDGLWPWTAEQDATLREMKARGMRTCDIAAAVGRTHSATAKRFEYLGLTRRHWDPAARRQRLLSTERGGNVMVESRWARARLALGEHGWPPDLTPKEVSILNSLYTDGPQSRRNLSLSIGEPATRNEKKRLQTHGGTSAMARLLARGLVTRCRLTDGRKIVNLYVLTEVARMNRGNFGSVVEFNTPLISRGTEKGRNSR